MSNSPIPEQRNDALYYQCFEQLLPLAGERVQAVAVDWWDLDRFLGLAFHIFLTETETSTRMQVAEMLPKFGAKSVLTLTVILRQEAIDAELKALASQCLDKIETPELVKGLINILKASEDESFDQQVVQMLANIGPEAITAVETLLADPDSRAVALRILPQLKFPRLVAGLEKAFNNSSDLSSQEACNALLQAAAAKAESHAYQQAIDIYSEAIDLCPHNARAFGDRGLLRSNIGDQQGAIADFQQAADLFRQQGSTANFEVALLYLNAAMVENGSVAVTPS